MEFLNNFTTTLTKIRTAIYTKNSFDLFDNYEHRGKLFKEEVLKS